MKNVTIYDVAKACNCTTTTVSKVFHHAGRISEAKAQHIREVAAEMGYFPSAVAVSLASKTSHTIGVIVHNSDNMGLTHMLFSRIFNEFRMGMESKGYEILILAQYNQNLGGTYLQRFRSKGRDGVFCLCCDYSQPEIQELLGSDIPMVCFDTDFGTYSITSDSIRATEDLTDYLLSLGHKRILYVHPKALASVSVLRLKGYKKALTKAGLNVDEKLIFDYDYFNSKSAAVIFAHYLECKGDFSAIMCPDDYTAAALIAYFSAHGVEVPSDISITGFDGIFDPRFQVPSITTMQQNTALIGDEACHLMIDAMSGGKEPQRHIVVPTTLFCGGSTRKI